VIKYKQRLARQVYTEWSVNEKVAFEIALAASWTGLRAAVAMKQVGLNVASDPLFSAAYMGVKGGFVIVPADDPGPHSSQTEQDSRLMALNAKVPVFDPATPAEARAMVEPALALSERFSLPVILRPTTRLCHARQSLAMDDVPPPDTVIPALRFRKDPPRWAATPKFRYRLHVDLNDRLRQVEAEFNESPLNYVVDEGTSDRVGVIASGVAFHTARQALLELGLSVPLLKIGTPYPLPRELVGRFMAGLQTVVVLEEPDACIELQLPDRSHVRGRLDGTVPAAGELSPEAVSAVLAQVLTDAGYETNPPPDDRHRSAFFALKREFGSNAIFPSDIGCYTLGINLRAVDTCVDMGASVSMATGFYQANRLVGDTRPIVATVGDSTFLHSGLEPLINAVHTGARFVLIILDNHTTAMTGFQPTAASETLAGSEDTACKVALADLVHACGVTFVKVADPYGYEAFRSILREAHAHCQAPEGGVAVVIADHPCVLDDPLPLRQNPTPVVITEECDGCRYCVEAFGCPALVLRPDKSRVDIDHKICVDCGQCIDACRQGFIVPQVMETARPEL
jgi:indolepyruvate ferredoxin oxidoreductase alpha subunit